MSTNGSTPHARKDRRRTHKFTFESTGYEVQYRCVPLERVLDYEMEWKANHPAPVVPAPLADVAGEQRATPNPSDPDYQRASTEYDTSLHNASYRYMLADALTLSEDDKAEVVEYREKHPHSNLDEDDVWVFIFKCACADTEEIGMLQNRILRLSQPTEAAIADVKARFQDTVQ